MGGREGGDVCDSLDAGCRVVPGEVCCEFSRRKYGESGKGPGIVPLDSGMMEGAASGRRAGHGGALFGGGPGGRGGR